MNGGGVPYVLGLVKESNTALDVQRKAAETLATITSRTDLLGKMIKHGMVRNLCLMPSNPMQRCDRSARSPFPLLEWLHWAALILLFCFNCLFAACYSMLTGRCSDKEPVLDAEQG